MSVRRAIVIALVILVAGGILTKLTHNVYAHGFTDRMAQRELACQRWTDRARIAAFDHAQAWRSAHHEPDRRSSATFWLAQEQVQRWYPNGDSRVLRPAGC